MDANAEVARLRSCLSAAETHAQSVQSAATARQAEVRGSSCDALDACAAVLTAGLSLQLEATVSRLTAELASSREAAEGLRRDLRSAQTDGEGRDRQHDASTRDLRKELRDCDETIGCVVTYRAPYNLPCTHLTLPRFRRSLRQQLRAAEAKPLSSSAQEVAHLAIIAELRAQLAVRGSELAGSSRAAPATYVAPVVAQQAPALPPVVAAPAPQQAPAAPRAAPKPRAKKPQADDAAPPPKKVRVACGLQHEHGAECVRSQAKVVAAPDAAPAPVAAAVPDAAPVAEAAPAAVAPRPASAAPQPEAAPRAAMVDITVPYSPPAAGGDSDSEFEPRAAEAKRAKAKPAKPKAPSAPKAKAPEAVAAPMPRVAAPAPEPAAAEPPAPVRAALAPLASNLPPPAPAAVKPRAAAPPGDVKKRKLLNVSTAVDTVPPAFLFGLMGGGGFTAPKLKPAF